MNYLFIGDIVNTHGIKGEVRIISDFKFKEDVFKVGNYLYVGPYKDKLEITSYRVHKNYDMVTFKGINDINEVLKYKGKKVYIIKEEYKFDGFLDEDIIGLDAYVKDKKIGVVTDILKSHAHPILDIENDGTHSFVPFIDEFVLNVDLESKRIDLEVLEGMINEN
ncbi:MAG: 16S rRNA processing protein RimM [Bacilli bacterium]|nr:16S rRNA processing protein RimM [Bacilli bacterium]